MLERVKTEQVVDVFQAIKTLRIQRPGLLESEVCVCGLSLSLSLSLLEVVFTNNSFVCGTYLKCVHVTTYLKYILSTTNSLVSSLCGTYLKYILSTTNSLVSSLCGTYLKYILSTTNSLVSSLCGTYWHLISSHSPHVNSLHLKSLLE